MKITIKHKLKDGYKTVTIDTEKVTDIEYEYKKGFEDYDYTVADDSNDPVTWFWLGSGYISYCSSIEDNADFIDKRREKHFQGINFGDTVSLNDQVYELKSITEMKLFFNDLHTMITMQELQE